MNTKKTIIVLGPPRSGTSLTGQILTLLGIDMGKIRIADPENPTGYFEDRDLLSLQDKILTFCGSEYNGFNLPKYSDLLKGVHYYLPDIKKYVEQRQQSCESSWGWKTTATCWTIEAMAGFIENPYFIILLRHPQKIAASQMRYTINKAHFYRAIDVDGALGLTLTYYRYISNFLGNHKFPVLYLSYENLLSHPDKELKKLALFLDIKDVPVHKIKKIIHTPSAMKFYKIKKEFGVRNDQSYFRLVQNFCVHPGKMIKELVSLIKRN